jgi:hypothetical protein
MESSLGRLFAGQEMHFTIHGSGDYNQIDVYNRAVTNPINAFDDGPLSDRGTGKFGNSG